MSDYKVIGIDLAKKKFYLAYLNEENKVVKKQSLSREEFFDKSSTLFPNKETFAFEACAGSNYMAQELAKLGHKVIILKTQDVKIYAKSKQKNDTNDAIAICKAACDPELMHVVPKTREQQKISYYHKLRQSVIKQRIQASNELIAALYEFGYAYKGGKSKFAQECKAHIVLAESSKAIDQDIYNDMLLKCEEISTIINQEKSIEKKIIASNKKSEQAKILETIPGIGPINASLFANKSVEQYESSKDFAASLGIVPKQNTTGGNIVLGSITKRGDRYARTMLIQGARSIVMRARRENSSIPNDSIYQLVKRLTERGKGFNVICVAVANKLARIIYACKTAKTEYVAI